MIFQISVTVYIFLYGLYVKILYFNNLMQEAILIILDLLAHINPK